jgi:hypothetical protein
MLSVDLRETLKAQTELIRRREHRRPRGMVVIFIELYKLKWTLPKIKIKALKIWSLKSRSTSNQTTLILFSIFLRTKTLQSLTESDKT